MTDSLWFWGLLVLAAAQLVLLLWLALRRAPVDAEGRARLQQVSDALQQQAQQGAQRLDRLEDELRREVGENARSGRQELLQTLTVFQDTLVRQGAETTRTQNAQIDAFAQQLVQLRGTLGDTLTQQLKALMESNERRLAEMRATLETQLAQLQTSNAAKLDEMRATVD
ncbi:MAG TPA: DNA recombination protein RmuC, partial [Hydrogenophaga sp.]|nr:DNA recombination protein RmuC [Hydrogenophaga sp.]